MLRKQIKVAFRSLLHFRFFSILNIIGLAAAFIATPLAWFAANNWLQGFYYHIQNAWLLIILSILLAITIAMLTISYHILKITRVNPVDSLRYE